MGMRDWPFSISLKFEVVGVFKDFESHVARGLKSPPTFSCRIHAHTDW